MAVVFISYSRVDKGIAAELRALLDLYLGKGTTFLDTADLDAGDAWRERIEREIGGATLFVALVSIEWSKSRSCQAEWALATPRHPELRVVPIPVGAGIVLGRLEAFAVHNAPTTEPLPRNLDTEAVRARLLPLVEKIADALRRNAGPAPRTSQPPPLPRLPPSEGPSRSDDPLRREHGADLRVAFARDGAGWRCALTVAGVPRGAWRVTDDELPSPAASLIEVGDALGRVLLAQAEDRWRSDPCDGPLKAHRCRVVTREPGLLALPWRLARLRGEWLVRWGWTFELADPDTLDADRRLGVNTRNLLLLPRAPRSTPPPDDAPLRTLLHGHGRHEHLIAVARDRREIQAAVAVRPPPALVVVAADPSGASLLADDEDDTAPLDARTCEGLCQPDDTLVLVLLGRTEPLLPSAVWLRRAATVVWSTRAPAPGEADEIARRLLEALVKRGRDPVWAVEHAAALGTPAAASLNVWTRWGTWSTDAPPFRASHAGAVLRELDREHARGAAREAVGHLVGDALGVRCLVLVATAHAGDPDLLPEELPGQIRDDLKVRVKEVGVVKRALVPPPAAMAPERFERHLDEQLAPPTGRSRAEHLRQMTDRQAHAQRPVLWFEPHHPLTAPDPARLVAWLVAFDRVVGRHAPPDRHVVLCCVALAADPTGLLEQIEGALAEAELSHTHVKLVDPIGDVRGEEIVALLSRTDASTCPTGRARAVANHVFGKTRGNFRKTVEILEAAENDGYATLLRDLERDRR